MKEKGVKKVHKETRRIEEAVATHTSHQVLFKDGRHMKLNRVKKEGNVLENTKKEEN